MAEHDGLTFAPVLVENLNAVFGFDHTHVTPLTLQSNYALDYEYPVLSALRLGLRGKQLAPAARADVALDEFASVRWLEIDAAVAVLVALRHTLIFGVRLADLLLRCRLRDRRSDCRRAECKGGAGERHAA